MDKVAKGRQYAARLNPALVQELRKRYDTDDITFKELSEEYGIPESTIYFAVTRRMWRHIAGGSTVTPAQRRQGSRNASAKLDDAAVRDIRLRYAAGRITQRELAEEYGVARTTITLIIQRHTWTHI